MQICSLKILKYKHVKINMNSASASSTEFQKQKCMLKCILEKQRTLFTLTLESKWNVAKKQTIK